MSNTIQLINLWNLAFAILPVVAVFLIYRSWKLKAKTVLYTAMRMVVQLFAIGFALTYILGSQNPFVTSGILVFMLVVASWIALQPVSSQRPALYGKALLSIGISGLANLGLTVFVIIQMSPWYEPRYIIPIAGMIFANAMNGVSLAADRVHAEMKRGGRWEDARNAALKTALLPITNAFLAVGLVSLPGMMTGQILAGISPLIAVRYQIMIMCVIYGSVGCAAGIYLNLAAPKAAANNTP